MDKAERSALLRSRFKAVGVLFWEGRSLCFPSNEGQNACLAESNAAFVDSDRSNQATAGEIAGCMARLTSGANQTVDLAKAD